MRTRLILLLTFMTGTTLPASVVHSATIRDWLCVVADSQIKARTMLRWDWGEGTLMQGMLAAWRVTDDWRYVSYVRASVNDSIKRGLKIDHGDRCLPGLSALALYRLTKDRRFLSAASRCVDFLLQNPTNDAPIWSRYWVDDLYMVAPLLAEYGGQTRQPYFKSLAAEQIERYAEGLINPDTGLFHHAWALRTKQRSPCAWARGNGWAAMAMVEVLGRLPKADPQRKPLLVLLWRQAKQLRMLQDSSGLWHTVVDHPETYLETSASAMIAYAFARAAHRGWIDAAYLQPARAALAGLVTQINEKGRLIGSSVGTGPGNVASYQRMGTGTTDWGTGAFLLLAAELVKDRRANLMLAGVKLPQASAGETRVEPQ